jgi:hypothetical protein
MAATLCGESRFIIVLPSGTRGLTPGPRVSRARPPPRSPAPPARTEPPPGAHQGCRIWQGRVGQRDATDQPPQRFGGASGAMDDPPISLATDAHLLGGSKRSVHPGEARVLYMIVETFRGGRPEAVYERVSEADSPRQGSNTWLAG